MLKRISILTLLVMFLGILPMSVKASTHNESGDLDVKEIIFEHLGDGYGWEVPFAHVYRIPLPIIVKAEDGKWFCFSSGDLTNVEVVKDVATGKEKKHLLPVIKRIEKNGKVYQFVLAQTGAHRKKVVELFPLSDKDRVHIDATLKNIKSADGANSAGELTGYINIDGKFYREYRPLDISITKNVLALFISAGLLTWIVMSLVRFYRRKGLQAPRKGMGFFEMLVSFVYYDTIKPILGENTKKFAPYLLTCFFFILTMNIVGLVVIFPGGANLTGNIAVTLVLAVMTFLMTNLFGKKHYWKEIFWPDVPIWLKCPIPIMQMIEVFGIFTKPAALCVRLFANMMGGHMIVITLVLIIFIFMSIFGSIAAGGVTIVSIAFTIFMLALDVLVSFIQAYVFTLLSTIFISSAQAHDHSHDEKKPNN